jgi:hypothetical protein
MNQAQKSPPLTASSLLTYFEIQDVRIFGSFRNVGCFRELPSSNDSEVPMNANDFVRSLQTEILGAPYATPNEEKKRIQQKQGGHHMPPRPEDGPPLDDTGRGTDKIIQPVRRDKELGKRHT